MQPAEEEELQAFLIDAGVPFGVNRQDRSEGEWAAFWRPYLSVLQGLPMSTLEAALDRWHKRVDLPASMQRQAAVRFFPQPGDIYELAIAHRTKVHMLRYRAQKALEYVEKKIEPRKRLDRDELIAKGLMNPDGSIPGLGGPKTMPSGALRPGGGKTPAQVAEELRRAGEQRAAQAQAQTDQALRSAGVPISRTAPPVEPQADDEAPDEAI